MLFVALAKYNKIWWRTWSTIYPGFVRLDSHILDIREGKLQFSSAVRPCADPQKNPIWEVGSQMDSENHQHYQTALELADSRISGIYVTSSVALVTRQMKTEWLENSPTAENQVLMVNSRRQINRSSTNVSMLSLQVQGQQWAALWPGLWWARGGESFFHCLPNLSLKSDTGILDPAVVR